MSYVKRESEITALLEQLLAIPSVSSDHEACERAIDLIEGQFAQTAWKTRRFERHGVHSLYVSRSAELSSDVLFLGHVDVVPAPSSLFAPKIRDGWMYGRGAADMKGSVATMVRLFLDYEGDPLFDSHALLLTSDEETGGFYGVNYLIEEHGLRTNCVFNPDGGGAFVPCVGEKGIIIFTLEAKGISTHGSRPWEGRNAIDVLYREIDRLRNVFDYADKEETWKISLNLGKIEGGRSANSVPDWAKAEIDVRYVAPMRSEDIIAKFRSYLEECVLEVVIEAPPVEVDQSDRNLVALMQALEVHGLPLSTMRENGGSDARWFVNQCASILLMLPETTAFHIEGEAVRLSSLSQFYEVLETFLKVR